MESKDGSPRTEDQQEKGVVCELHHFVDFHGQENLVNSGSPGDQVPFQEGQSPPVPDECIRGGNVDDLVAFSKDFNGKKDGSGVVLFPELRKANIPTGSPFPLHNVVESFTNSVQLRENEGFKYVFKKERWAHASKRCLEKEIRLGHAFEGVCKVLGVVKQVDNWVDLICFLLEYSEGQTLEQRRKRADWDIESAKDAFGTILSIVSKLEQKELMITDLKPGNFCFRSEDPRSICLVDLESVVDLTGNQRAFRYTAQFSPPFRLDLCSSPESKTKQMKEWHRWSLGVTIACCLPPFTQPWQEEMQRCNGQHSKLHELIIKHRKGIRKYLPFRRPPNDQWRPMKSYLQLTTCMVGLLSLDLPRSIEDCLGFAIFTGAAKVRLVLMTTSGECLGGLQMDTGTTVKEVVELPEFRDLVPFWRDRCRLMVSGKLLCPTTAFFKNEVITTWVPLQVVITLKDGQTNAELGKIHLYEGTSLREMLETGEWHEVMEGWNGGKGLRLKNSSMLNIFSPYSFMTSQEVTVWPPL